MGVEYVVCFVYGDDTSNPSSFDAGGDGRTKCWAIVA